MSQPLALPSHGPVFHWFRAGWITSKPETDPTTPSPGMREVTEASEPGARRSRQRGFSPAPTESVVGLDVALSHNPGFGARWIGAAQNNLRLARLASHQDSRSQGGCGPLVSRLDIHQHRRLGPMAARRNRLGLRRAPMVDVADPVYAADGAVGRAALGGQKLPLHIGRGVIGNRHARIAALLAAIVDQPVLADIQIARTCAATPVVGPPLRNRLLNLSNCE